MRPIWEVFIASVWLFDRDGSPLFSLPVSDKEWFPCSLLCKLRSYLLMILYWACSDACIFVYATMIEMRIKQMQSKPTKEIKNTANSLPECISSLRIPRFCTLNRKLFESGFPELRANNSNLCDFFIRKLCFFHPFLFYLFLVIRCRGSSI